MSYVIQNFINDSKKLYNTPRIKTSLFLKNMKKINTMYVYNNYLFFQNKSEHLNYLLLFDFLKYFFFQQYKKTIYNLKIFSTSYYSNNMFKSTSFLILYNLNQLLRHNNKILINLNSENVLLYNYFFLPQKTFPVYFKSQPFKKIFFFFFFSSSYLWYQHCNSYLSYLNFLIIQNNLKVLKNYNGFFFKIYNY